MHASHVNEVLQVRRGDRRGIPLCRAGCCGTPTSYPGEYLPAARLRHIEGHYLARAATATYLLPNV